MINRDNHMFFCNSSNDNSNCNNNNNSKSKGSGKVALIPIRHNNMFLIFWQNNLHKQIKIEGSNAVQLPESDKHKGR